MFFLDCDNQPDAENPGSSEFAMKRYDLVALIDHHLLSLPIGPLYDILWPIQKVPTYVESRLTPEIYSRMIDQFSNEKL
jgi:hypothetical protein